MTFEKKKNVTVNCPCVNVLILHFDQNRNYAEHSCDTDKVDCKGKLRVCCVRVSTKEVHLPRPRRIKITWENVFFQDDFRYVKSYGNAALGRNLSYGPAKCISQQIL